METVFPDGLLAPALFSFTEDDKKRALLLGYDDNVEQMHREHDPAHTFLAEAEGLLYSPVLRGVATRKYLTQAQIDAEEHKVLMFQRYMNTGVSHPVLHSFSLPELMRRFRAKIKEGWS